MALKSIWNEIIFKQNFKHFWTFLNLFTNNLFISILNYNNWKLGKYGFYHWLFKTCLNYFRIWHSWSLSIYWSNRQEHEWYYGICFVFTSAIYTRNYNLDQKIHQVLIKTFSSVFSTQFSSQCMRIRSVKTKWWIDQHQRIHEI